MTEETRKKKKDTKPQDRPFQKTTVIVEILSEGDCPDYDTLLDLHQLITTGDCSGIHHVKSVKMLTKSQAARELVKQGSDPGFFGIE